MRPTHLRAVDLNRFLFQQLNAQIKYSQDFQGQFYSFRLKSGVLVDFVISVGGSALLAYSVGIGNHASPHQIRSAEAFLKFHPQAKVLLLHMGEAIRELHSRMVEAPLSLVI